MSEIERAAEKAGIIGFNTALDALFIKRSDTSQCIAWHGKGEGRMVSRNVGVRGAGSWGESRVFTADRTTEFVKDAADVEVIDKRPFNLIAGAFEKASGLGVGTAWAVAFHFNDGDAIVRARARRLQAVPGVGEVKARHVRRAIGHLDPPSEWSKEQDEGESL